LFAVPHPLLFSSFLFLVIVQRRKTLSSIKYHPSHSGLLFESIIAVL
jgi:hypothetical protein